MSTGEAIVFLGVEVGLFKVCFVDDIKEDHVKSKAWSSFEWIELDTDSPSVVKDFSASLSRPGGVCSVVFQDVNLQSSLLARLKQFYDSGGSVVFFGVEGEFSAPQTLSQQFGLPEAWRFSGYTSHEYELTNTAMHHLGYTVKGSQYSKSNLLLVPVQDRWMVAKPQPLHQYIEDMAGCLDGQPPCDEWKRGADEAKEKYVSHCEEQYSYCPLAVHQNKSGGRLAYLGFVNSDDNIPQIVRSLVTKKQIPFYTIMFGWG